MTDVLDIEQFEFPNRNETGKHRYFLKIGSQDEEQIGIPVLVANGHHPGKTLVVFACVHGDELEGVQAIHDVFNVLEPEEMRGRFIAVPIANLPAYRAVTRTSPIDGMNLARTFPGKKNGTVTEQIAYHLSNLIIREADLFLDLHSSGVRSLMPTMVGYDAGGTVCAARSKEAALAFGMPVIWGHKSIGPGRSICSAAAFGIPWLYVESPNGACVSPIDLPFYVNGALNLLGYLGVISRIVERTQPMFRLLGSGDVDTSRCADISGFFVHHVKLMERVEKDQSVGEIRDIFGQTIEKIHAERKGFVAMLRSTPVVSPGDTLFLIADEDPVTH
jgi:predicted deacylase